MSGLRAMHVLGSSTSFPIAARELLETLEQRLPRSAVYVGHFDRAHDTFWVIDSAGETPFGLEPGMSRPLTDSFDAAMADDRAPRMSHDAAGDPVYGDLRARYELSVGSYMGVPIDLPDGHRVGSLSAIAREPASFTPEQLELLEDGARMLAGELERQRRETEMERLSLQLREQAATDSVTGLRNRRAFLERAEREWALSRRDGIPSHLVLCDVEGLAGLGRDERDEAAAMFGRTLHAAARGTDVVGRIGRDRFAVVLVHTLQDGGPDSFRARLSRCLEDELMQQPLPVSLSSGVAPLAETSSLELAFEEAARRLFEDKARTA